MSEMAKPCPFCGHDDIEINEIEPGRCAIDCPECECIGPFSDSVKGAIEAWNKPVGQRDELLAELLRVKDICLREAGVGIVNEVVIANAKGGAE